MNELKPLIRKFDNSSLIFQITQLKIVVAKIQKMEKMRLDEI